MGEGEVAIAVICTLVAAVGWIALFVVCGGVSAAVAREDGGRAKGIFVLAPICALVIIAAVLLTISARDVRNDPRYIWLYGAMGLAVVRLALGLPSPAGINPSRDAVQGRNTAAAWTYVATAAAYALAFSGANVGDGPGFEVVIFTFVLSCGTLYLFHAGLQIASGLATRVTSDRSAVAAWRLGALLIAAGAICGRAACGNWVSATHTLNDFVATAWVLPVFIVIEGVAARVGSPRVEDGFARFAAMLTSAAYLLAAAGYIISRGAGDALPPLRASELFSASAVATLRRRAVFEAGKWGPQVHDGASLAPFALRIVDADWATLCSSAEALWRDLTAIERALQKNPRLLGRLTIPRRTRAAIKAATVGGPALRFARFDFHPTEAGWRVSEVNADVPGGFLESGPIARMVAEQAGGVPTADTAAMIVDELATRLPAGSTVALVHATAYTDDLQVMDHFRRLVEPRGLTGVPCSPDHLRWDSGGRCTLTLTGGVAAVGALVRFFPAEWLANLPRSTPIAPFFASSPGGPILANPATALAVQSKRIGLCLDALGVDAPAWRELVPPTVPAFPLVYTHRQIPDRWVLKPAMGRVGEGVVIAGATQPADARRALRAARMDPRDWLLQERFSSLPVEVAGTPYHACIGVYVVSGRAAGAYARVSTRPLIDAHAQDAALLIDSPVPAAHTRTTDHPSQRSTPRATAGVL